MSPVSRRQFLTAGAAAGGGLLLGWHLDARPRVPAAAVKGTLPAFAPSRGWFTVTVGEVSESPYPSMICASKTAVKASFGRYTPYSIAGVDIPANNQANSTTRTWNDTLFGAGDARSGNYVPDCDLRNSGTNGECGGWSDLTFGQIRAGSTRRATDALGGFNRQDYNWQLAAQVQHQLAAEPHREWSVVESSFRYLEML